MKSEDLLDSESTENVIKKSGDPSEDVSKTPRTDAARERNYGERTSDWVHYTICGMLKKELAEAKDALQALRDAVSQRMIPDDPTPEDRKRLFDAFKHADAILTQNTP